jgi:hypothetical protein
MPTEKKKIAAYLADDVGRRFDEFKRIRGIKGDSQALNQLLSEYFGVAESLSPPPSLLSRVEALEMSLMNAVRGKVGLSGTPHDLEVGLDEKGWLTEEEVAELIQMPLDKLRRMKGSQPEKAFNRWLLKTSKEYGSPINYSSIGYSLLSPSES